MKMLSLAFQDSGITATLVEKTKHASHILEKLCFSEPWTSPSALPNVISALTQKFSARLPITIHLPETHFLFQKIKINPTLSDDEIFLFIEKQLEKSLQWTYQITPSRKTALVVAAEKKIIADIQAAFTNTLFILKIIEPTLNATLKNMIAQETSDKINFNFLSWKEPRKNASLKNLLFGLICAFMITACLVQSIKFFILEKTHALFLQQQAIQKKRSDIPVNDIKKRAILFEKINRLWHEKQIMDNNNQQLQTLLFAIANQLPSSMTLDTLTVSNNTFQLSGNSTNTADIHTYSNNLQTALKKNIVLNTIEKDAENSKKYIFSLEETA